MRIRVLQDAELARSERGPDAKQTGQRAEEDEQLYTAEQKSVCFVGSSLQDVRLVVFDRLQVKLVHITADCGSLPTAFAHCHCLMAARANID